MIVIISSSSGPPGTNVTITGAGFTEGGNWNATLGDDVIFTDGVVDSNGNLKDALGNTPSFIIPTMDQGIYDVSAGHRDGDRGLSKVRGYSFVKSNLSQTRLLTSSPSLSETGTSRLRIALAFNL